MRTELPRHTPGPWEFIARPNPSFSGYITTFGRGDVASIYARTDAGDAEVNARLIAAAPDLLAALKAVVAFDADGKMIIAGRRHAQTQALEAVLEGARAVIAKAEGRS